MKTTKCMWIVAAIALLMFGSGCTKVQRYAAVGASGGALVGGLLAADHGILSAGEGAAVGAAAGGLAGALLADQMAEEQAGNVGDDEYANLQQQIADKDRLLQEKMAELNDKSYALAEKDKQLADLQKELDALRNKLAEQEGQLAERQEDVDALRKKLDEMQVTLTETNKGLELTILDELLFEAGQDKITDEGKKVLDQIAQIVKERFPNRELQIEGHTDNQPIVHSGWKSNWELGSARALAVLHYMEDQWAFQPANLGAVTYGQWRPVENNDNEDGKRKNRRAVIIIYPEDAQVVKERRAGF